ncbi:hypothetical protein LTR85_007255 [Meristemomyces frigidus]|nr:hypothetical protein LTR85_007255 [Meristemomyces frigidus]
MSMPYLVPHRAAQPQALGCHNVRLVLRQQPDQGLVTQDNKEKGRKPIDPPPIIQMMVVHDTTQPPNDASEQWLVSPYLFMVATLMEGEEGENMVPGKHIIGQNSSSLHRLKDVTNKDGGFFVFGDLSIKRLGRHRIRFSLFNADQHGSTYLTSIDSAPFEVVPSKDFRGLSESSHLSRAFSDQGVRLRLRKEARQLGTAGHKRQWESPEDTTPPQAPAAGYSAGQGSQYTYGTPSVKRQRSDYDLSNTYAYQQYSDNAPRYYTNSATPTGGAGRTPGGQDQAYHQNAQLSNVGSMPVHDLYQNSHYGLHGAVQGAGTPVAHSTTMNSWAGTLPQGPMSAPAAGSADMYGRNAMAPRANYFEPDYQHHTSGHYGAQVQQEPYYQTPTSMTGSISQVPAYLPSNTGDGSVQEPATSMDSSLGIHGYDPGELGPTWSSSRPTSMQPIPSAIQATAPPTASSEAYYPQTYSSTSKYPNNAAAPMSLSDPYPITSYSSSPLRTYPNSTLGDSTLNSAFPTGEYPEQ